MKRRKKMTRPQSKRVWRKGSRMNKRNMGVYSRRNRGGVRF